MKNQNIIFFAVSGFLAFLTVATIWQDHDREWKQYQKTFYKMQADLAETEEEKEKLLDQSVRIKQILLSANDADRCVTCHLGLEDPRMKDAPQPYTTHPGKNRHKFENFGCTVCHQGQGLATTVADAHGHVSFWEEPMLGKDEAQATCNHCHDQIYLEDGPIISKGKELFISLGCHGCHNVEGYENLHKAAPSLKRVGSKVDPSWLVRWIKEPGKYLPDTKMPNFRLSEEEALSIAAYLISQSDSNYHEPIKYSKGNAKNGETLFKTVGCLGCHKIGSDGNAFAPNLSNVANKVKPDWLVNWFLDPKGYNPHTVMPKFRLTAQQAQDLSTFLLTAGAKQPDSKYEEEVKSQERIKKGKELIAKRGCSACHDINGVENVRIGPELNKIGAKLAHHLDFGNTHDVEHTWVSWIENKLKDPTIYNTEVIQANMPTFNLSDNDRKAVAVFLRSLAGKVMPSNFIKQLSAREFEIDQGRKAIARYNCKGCHKIDNEGGGILKFYKGKFNAPPPLEMGGLHVGDRLKDSWMYSFLREPSPVRGWLKVKMPTFLFSQDDIYYITRYFVNFAEDKVPYERGIRDIPPDDYLKEGRKLVLAFECEECHDQKGSRGPKFSVVSKRVRKDWAKNWLKNTQTLYPGTKMPDHWPLKDGKRVVLSKFPKAMDMLDGDVDKQIDAIWEYIANYNEKPFLDVELPADEEEEEEEEVIG